MSILEKTVIGLVFILTLIGAGVTYGYSKGAAGVQFKFDKYKGEVHEQIKAQLIKNAATEAAQDAKFNHAKAGYSSDVNRLNLALQRLRDSRIVPRDSALPVANPNGSTLPEKAGDTSRVAANFEAGFGTHPTDAAFYAAAMSDTLQCRTLINFLK